MSVAPPARDTTVFLGVEGVINTDMPRWPAATHRESTINFGDYTEPRRFRWSVSVVDALRAVDARTDLEMVWLTGWEWLVEAYIAPVIGVGVGWRWEEQDYFLQRVATPPLGWWKAEAVRRAVRWGHRVVWIDSQWHTWRNALARVGKVDRLEWLTDDVLVVAPQPEYGLEPSQFEVIARFLSAVPGTTS